MVSFESLRMKVILFLSLFQNPYPVELCNQWNSLYEKMQYGSVDRKEKGKVLRQIVKQLRELITVQQDSSFYFPIEGYDVASVGGNGSGFIERTYNFLHGNAHRGHPAHDIFIHDTNQDGMDDNTGKAAYIIAMTDGIVLGAKPIGQNKTPCAVEIILCCIIRIWIVTIIMRIADKSW